MTSPTKPGDDSSIWTGLFLAGVATVSWYFFIGWGTALVNEDFFDALVIGAAVMCVGGVLLTAPKRTRHLGIGLAIGAPIALVVEIAALSWLILNATS